MFLRAVHTITGFKSKLKGLSINMLLTLQLSSKCTTVMGESAWALPAILSTPLLYQRKDCHLTVICIHTSNHADWASTHQKKTLSLKIFITWFQHDNNMLTAESSLKLQTAVRASYTAWSQWVYFNQIHARISTHTSIGWTRDGRSKSVTWQDMSHWEKATFTLRG